jgi:hypothetical protein
LKELGGLKMATVEEMLWLYVALDHELCYNETEGPIMILFGIN